MRPLRLIPDDTAFRAMRWRGLAFAITILTLLATVTSLATRGLALGLDFTGGVLVEARRNAPFEIAQLRAQLTGLQLGEVSMQAFGGDRDVMIRVQQQPGGAEAQMRAVSAITAMLGSNFEIRRSEVVGPQVSRELLRDGVVSALLAVLLIGIYVWFRFEWQFGLSAVLTTFHDVIAVVGLFSLFQLEFNLTIVAALLTVAGYSVNDTVVVFDRVRENRRRYKTLGLSALIDRSVNQTLSRTVMTSGTTLLAVLALLVFGGPVLRNFSLALVVGLVVGTYSSVYVASALLLYMPSPQPSGEPSRPDDGAAAPAPGD
ncbi:MAG: protein translocase subunit SecF [Alphaproteobacteria bacterium]